MLALAAPVALGVSDPQFQAESRLAGIWGHRACYRHQRAIEQHLLDPLMVVEILDVPEVGNAGGGAGMEVRSAMTGDLQALRRCQLRRRDETREPAAAGRVDLQAVHGAGVEQRG